MRKQEFNSKLISLLLLDEVPVHVPLRRPRPLRLERLRVPVWNPYSRGRLGPAKSEDPKGGEGSRRQSHNFFSTDATPWHPNSPPRPGEAPHPAPAASRLGNQTASRTALCDTWGHLPLDEIPVHVHHFAARAPCDSKGSECQCGIHRAETA